MFVIIIFHIDMLPLHIEFVVPDFETPLNFILAICPSDWRYWNGYCWYTSTGGGTFQKAQKLCTDVSARSYLASIHSPVDNWFLSGMKRKTKRKKKNLIIVLLT